MASSSSSSDEELAFGVPANVRTHVPVPPAYADLGSSAGLAELYGLSGEQVNNALELIRDQFNSKYGHYAGTSFTNEVEDTKKILRGYMVSIKLALDAAGNGAFGVPRQLRKAFEYLNLKWPPVMTDADLEQDP